MRGVKPILAGLLVAAISLATACERAVSPTAAGEYSPDRWRSGADRSGVPYDVSRPLDLTAGHKELAALDTPKIPAAGADDPLPDHFRRFTVNLFPSEFVLFRGEEYPLQVDRERSKQRLAVALGDLARAKWIWWFGILLRCDRSSTWGTAAELVDVVRASVPQFAAFHIASDIGVFPTEGRIEAALLPPLAADDSTATPVSLDVLETPTGLSPRLQFGDRTWTFPAGDPYAAGPTLDAANANWEAIRAALAGSGAAAPAPLRLTIDPRAPWSHVAQLLGVALVARRTDVDLPQHGYGVRLSALPPPYPIRASAREQPPRPQGERDPRDWPTWLGIGVGVAAAGLLVLWGQRRYPPRRRKPAKKTP